MIVAETVLPWKLDAHDCSLTVEKLLKNTDITDESATNLFVQYQRKTYILKISRRLAKVSKFAEDVGELKSFFSYETGGGAWVNYGATNKVWRCIADSLASTDMSTGEVTQTQTWAHESEAEIVDMTEYTTPVT